MYQPVVPFDGLAGWRFLQRTYDTQQAAFNESSQIKRDTDYFKENISKIQNAEELVSDRRLLTVALGAFGLQDDINNKFFIQKMLQEGTTNEDAFANRFTDTRYQELSSAFGFGPGEFRLNSLSGFAERISGEFERQSFEVAVGTTNEKMRIALNAEREFADLAFSAASETGKWFQVMSKPPLRSLFETALGLPDSIAQIDIDQQQEMFANRSEQIFGTRDPADFNDVELQEKLITRYMALSQISANGSPNSSGASNALTLLRGF